MKERKPKTQTVIMIKTGQDEYGDKYSALDAEGATLLGGRKSFEISLPVRGRSLSQNSLWAVWYKQIGKELGQTSVEIKKECKLNYGVPIYCEQDKGFARMWQKLFEPLSYGMQLSAMKHIGVTRELNKTNGVIYTETLQREYAKNNILLEVL